MKIARRETKATKCEVEMTAIIIMFRPVQARHHLVREINKTPAIKLTAKLFTATESCSD